MVNRKIHKHFIVIGLIGVLALSLLLTGCPPRGQQRRPEPPKGQPTREEPQISVYINQTGETKQMNIEEYIAGVVAAEMDVDWPIEALAAQAILARTYTMEAIERRGGVPERGTDASTSVEEFQAWDGAKVNDRVREAVNSTRGEVAVYEGKYINAWFHAYSGGKTATAQEGLEYDKTPTPFIHSVDDPGVNYAPDKDKDWTATFKKAEVRAAALRLGKQIGDFNEIRVGERGPSGRATTLVIGDTSVSAPGFRINIGSTKLKSTLISSITVSGDNVTFKGTGFGHGVGMSQWGAFGMAEEGKSPEEIVEYFYKDIEIQKKWN